MSHKILDDSNQKYKKLYDSGHYKFKQLPYWHRSKSDWLEKEYHKQIKPHYKKYKRGTIVYVDFGVNVGSEISGHHFAVVVNIFDNPRNPLTTVIPLTSKESRFYLHLDNTVIKNAISLLKQHIETINRNLESLQEKIESTFSGNEVSSDTNDVLIQELGEAQRDVQAIEKVVNIYSRYNKQTYACVSNIQTISKLKIKTINRFDPSGRMEVSNENLNAIDDSVKKIYTS
jgi:mRNA-degrading endonuclease toxin of MazEF toxin-antitoxin module